MRNFRRLVLGFVLMSLAGVSWGEEDLPKLDTQMMALSNALVSEHDLRGLSHWICNQETNTSMSLVENEDEVWTKQTNHRLESFKVFYLAKEDKVALIGRQFIAEPNALVLDCYDCQVDGFAVPMIGSSIDIFNFRLHGQTFFYSGGSYFSATASSGRCSRYEPAPSSNKR